MVRRNLTRRKNDEERDVFGMGIAGRQIEGREKGDREMRTAWEIEGRRRAKVYRDWLRAAGNRKHDPHWQPSCIATPGEIADLESGELELRPGYGVESGEYWLSH
jgi:hypothetical protein